MARSRGLQPADAEDFVQELLLAVAHAAGRWEPDSNRARFRTWLSRIARNLLADHFHKARRGACVAGLSERSGDFPEQVEVDRSTTEVSDEFDLEYRRALFHRAAGLVRQRVSDSTWDAFTATAIDAVPAAAVSLRLGIPVGSVYVARSRVMKMLRLEIERLEALTIVARQCKLAEPDQEPQR